MSLPSLYFLQFPASVISYPKPSILTPITPGPLKVILPLILMVAVDGPLMLPLTVAFISISVEWGPMLMFSLITPVKVRVSYAAIRILLN